MKTNLDEIKKSKEQLRKIIDTIPTLAWCSPQDRSAELISACSNIPASLRKKRWMGGWKVAIHPDDLPHMLETFNEALNLGRSFEVEGRFRRWDGEFRWFLFRGSPLLDGSGKVVKRYGTNSNLEDRNRAEEARRQTVAQISLVADMASKTLEAREVGASLEVKT